MFILLPNFQSVFLIKCFDITGKLFYIEIDMTNGSFINFEHIYFSLKSFLNERTKCTFTQGALMGIINTSNCIYCNN